jgi:hypothetical protein
VLPIRQIAVADQDHHHLLLMTLSQHCDIIMSDGSDEEDTMKTIGRWLAPFRMAGRRNDRYYQGVIAQGAGYPTYDEARKDLMLRDAAVSTQVGWR